jgi:hypothetical protein
MLRRGNEVREIPHDGCPVACRGDAPFGYVNVFNSHVNVGFFHGRTAGSGPNVATYDKFMRHVKLQAGRAIDAAALSKLIEMAYLDIKTRVESS